MRRYNPKEIEPKWQKVWAEKKLYKAVDFDERPKFVMLTEFPYPSGDGLHLGHVREYTLGDIMARRQRMAGKNVLYPMGYDAFGLPTENYAIKNKIAPQIATDQNVGNFQQQFDSLGYSIDWDRSFRTSDPSYYKWTQWLFLQFYKAGLAYQDEIAINWCPKCKTGLANEEVVNGRHERCDTPVEKKFLKQWILKITDYADRLIDGLQTVDYPSRIADQQTNWIGRSVGAEVDFEIDSKLKFVVLHGFMASSKDHFHPWLKAELEKRGHEVYIPDLPNTNHPDAEEQAKFVLDNFELDENTVLIGHSYGTVTALRILEQVKVPIYKYISVAGFAEPKFLDKLRPFEETTNWNFDFPKIKNNVQEIVFLRASNDSAVPQERSDFLMKNLQGEIVDFTAEANHVCGEKEPVVLATALQKVTVFTTRPDTLFGATFMVLAPEHPLVKSMTTPEQSETVGSYIKMAQAKSDIERQENKEKTGVFTGAYVVNPVNNDKIPVWIADYVLTGYGTGAIMAVPAHDERDYEFAQKFDLPVRQVIAPYITNSGKNAARENVETLDRQVVDAIIKNDKDEYLLLVEEDNIHFVGGGIEPEDKDEQEAVKREIKEETGHTDIAAMRIVSPVVRTFAFRIPKNKNQRCDGTFYEVLLASDRRVESEVEEGKHQFRWVKKSEVEKLITWEGHVWAWQQYLSGSLCYSGEGILINSGKYDGLSTSEAREKITQDLEAQGFGKERVNYKLRDWIFSRQHYWGEPIPVIHCGKDGAVPVPDEQLPVELPSVDNYEPTDTGESPLAAIEDWVNVACPKCGGEAKRETDTMPNWAGSSWYYLRYFDAHNDQAFADRKKLDYWGVVDMYLGGMEHTTLHLLYSRFWHQFFYDQKLVPTPEPYAARRGQGIILAEDGTKMSKSKGNVINPTDIISQGYGADALRIGIAFLAPYDQTTAWKPDAVTGAFRFLQRYWTLVQEYLATASEPLKENSQLPHAVHRLIKDVSIELEHMRFNTAIAALMECLNELYKFKAEFGFGDRDGWQFALITFTQLLAPFAPHITEEVWSLLRQNGSVHNNNWPVHDEKLVLSKQIIVVVQINGKVRGQFEVAAEISQDELIALVQQDQKVSTHLANKQIRKTIYVPGRLVNFVV